MGVSGQRHASAALYPRWKDPRYPLDWGWVGIRAGMDTYARGKILCLCLGSNPGLPACSHTLYWLSYPSSLITSMSSLLILHVGLFTKQTALGHKPGFNFWHARGLFSSLDPFCGPTSLLYSGYQHLLRWGQIKRSVKLNNRLHLVSNEWNYTSTPLYASLAWCLTKHTVNFHFLDVNKTADKVRERSLSIRKDGGWNCTIRNCAAYRIR
jgi:hypothetical protein